MFTDSSCQRVRLASNCSRRLAEQIVSALYDIFAATYHGRTSRATLLS